MNSQFRPGSAVTRTRLAPKVPKPKKFTKVRGVLNFENARTTKFCYRFYHHKTQFSSKNKFKSGHEIKTSKNATTPKVLKNSEILKIPDHKTKTKSVSIKRSTVPAEDPNGFNPNAITKTKFQKLNGNKSSKN